MQPPHRSKITTPLYFPGPRIPALAVVQRDALKDASKHTVTKRRFRVVNKSSARRGFIGHPMVADSAAASLVSSVHWRNQALTLIENWGQRERTLLCEGYTDFQSTLRPIEFKGVEGRNREECCSLTCWFIAAAAWVRWLPLVRSKSSVDTACGQKTHLNVIPPLIGLVV